MRTPAEILAGLGKYVLACHRGNRLQYKYAKIVARNMNRSAEELQSEQLKALSRIVDYAYRHSRYYKIRFDEAGFKPGDIKKSTDLAGLPELTKEQLIENMDDILCIPKSECTLVTTSGTTGITMNFYRGRKALSYRRGIDLALFRYYGWLDGQWMGWLWGASPDVLNVKTRKAKFVRNWGERYFFMDVSNLATKAFREFVNLTKQYKPPLVAAYPSLAFDLAERIEAGEVDKIRVPVLTTTAEPLLDLQREKIKKYLADEVYDRYGAREYGIVGYECSEHKGLHVLTESVFLESVQEEGTGDLPGVLLVTDLLNTGMPLIRYHSGDFADLDFSACPCGLPTPRINNIKGREADTIWRSDGSGINGLHITHIIEKVNINKRLQVYQEAIDHIIIRFEGNPDDFKEKLDNLIIQFQREIGPDIKYEIQSTEKIERAPSGKFRNVISKVKRPDSD